MKKRIAILCAVFMLFSQLSAFAEVIHSVKVTNPELTLPIDPASVAKDGVLVIEGENMIWKNDGITVSKDVNASGGAVLNMLLPEHNTAGADTVTQPDFKYTAHFNEPGTYTLWIRVKGNVSFYYSVNGGEKYDTRSVNDPSGAGTEFHWIKLGVYGIFDGVFDLCFAHRYRTLILDKIILTTDNSFIPTGKDDYPQFDTTILFPEPEIKPIEGHPRLYLTETDIPKLKENAAQPLMAAALKYCSDNARWPVAGEGIMTGSYNATVPVRMRGRAMMYILGKVDDEHGRETIRMMRNYLETATYPNVGDITREIGDAIQTGAVVYDWLYDLMTEEDKQVYIARFKYLATQKEIGYPPTKDRSLYGHSCEREIFMDLLSAGIAVYDEDTEIYELAAGRYFSEMVPSRVAFNKTGNHASGSSYGEFRFRWEIFSTLIFERMGYPNVMGEEIATVPYRWIYSRQPMGTFLKEGDATHWSGYQYFNYEKRAVPIFMLIGNMYDDPVLYGEWLKVSAMTNYADDPFWQLLLWDKDKAEAKGIDFGDDLPLTYVSAYPITQMFARTGWQMGLDSTVAQVQIQARERFACAHEHPDLGSFQIYYKGNLAIDSGAAGGSDAGWLTSFDKNYNRRTVAHNCMTIFDPEEVFENTYYSDSYDWDGWSTPEPVSNDGGQDIKRGNLGVASYYDYDDFLENKIGDTNGDGIGEDLAATKGVYVGPNDKTPEFSYIKTDLTNAYGGRKDDEGNIIRKVKDYKRSMVFMDLFNDDYPAAFICYDKVESSNPTFEKNWLLHSIEEPKVDGNTTVIARTENGFNGKLVNKTMLPANPDIEVIGGEGKEFWVNGKNYPNEGRDGYDMEQGSWRIEVSPASNTQTTDLFLNSMYVTDYDRNLPELPMYQMDTAQFVGVTVKDRVVMFSKTANPVSEEFSFEVMDNNNGGIMSCLVTDVTPGIWKVEGAGTICYVEVTEEGNALYFKGAPGNYTVTPAEEGKKADERVYEETPKAKLGDFLVYSSDGLFRNQKSETKLIDGVPYLSAKDYFPYYGTQIQDNADGSMTLTYGTMRSMTIRAGSKECVYNGQAKTLQSAPIDINGNLYVNPTEFGNIINSSVEYDDMSKMLNVTILADIENLLTAAGGDLEHAVIPVGVEASSNDGNVEQNMFDWNLETRWTGDGRNEWFIYDLGGTYDLSYILAAFYSGHRRSTTFEIEVSADGKTWRRAFEGTSCGTTEDFERFDLANADGVRYLKCLAHGNNLNSYNSITEFVVMKK